MEAAGLSASYITRLPVGPTPKPAELPEPAASSAAPSDAVTAESLSVSVPLVSKQNCGHKVAAPVCTASRARVSLLDDLAPNPNEPRQSKVPERTPLPRLHAASAVPIPKLCQHLAFWQIASKPA
ncbi:hypothetical protein CFAM422_001919 [Trichoderma lentiforme]|uniref:Uncharacterized protein n=1 Tax=Trichoderma lentiforme TaxID=1567552 RepID=A0A9P4XMK7_9HYPO|nr:hypothetical protein CFAM422_001919 [Trichoderma lentiforme]